MYTYILYNIRQAYCHYSFMYRIDALFVMNCYNNSSYIHTRAHTRIHIQQIHIYTLTRIYIYTYNSEMFFVFLKIEQYNHFILAYSRVFSLYSCRINIIKNINCLFYIYLTFYHYKNKSYFIHTIYSLYI